MGFKIAQGQPDVKTTWLPVDGASTNTLYVGQLCKTFSVSGAINGAAPLAVASGAADVNNGQIITGIVIGTNNYPMTETFDSTYGQYMAYANTQAAQKAIQKMGQEGMTFPKGDPIPLVQVALLTPSTIIEAPVFYTTYGTAITLQTVTTGSATGAGFTANACQLSSIYTTNRTTTYCRTGANAGLCRVNADVSTTVSTFTTYFPNAIAVGDTFVRVPYVMGDCSAQINATSNYIGVCLDGAIGPNATAGYFLINVVDMNLSEAGKEKIYFRFNAIHFATRLSSTSGTTGT